MTASASCCTTVPLTCCRLASDPVRCGVLPWYTFRSPLVWFQPQSHAGCLGTIPSCRRDAACMWHLRMQLPGGVQVAPAGRQMTRLAEHQATQHLASYSRWGAVRSCTCADLDASTGRPHLTCSTSGASSSTSGSSSRRGSSLVCILGAGGGVFHPAGTSLHVLALLGPLLGPGCGGQHRCRHLQAQIGLAASVCNCCCH